MSFFSDFLGPPNIDNLKAKRDVSGLIKALDYKGDQDWKIHQNAAVALGEIGDIRAIKPLINAMSDNGAVRSAAAEALGKIGTPAVEPLIAILKDRTVTNQGNVILSETLGKIGSPAVEPLITVIKEGNQAERWMASRALGEIRDHRAVDPLITLLKNGNKQEHVFAATALGQIGDTRAVDPLIAALKDGNNAERWCICTALGEIGDHRAVDPLIAVLKEKDVLKASRIDAVVKEKDVLKAATEALEKMGVPAFDLHNVALKTLDENVHKYTIKDIDNNGDKNALRMIKKLLSPSELITYEEFDRYAQNIIDTGELGILTLISCLNDAYRIRADMHILTEVSIIVANKTNHSQLISLLLEMKENGINLITGYPEKILWMQELQPEIIGDGKYGWQTLPGSLGSYSP